MLSVAKRLDRSRFEPRIAVAREGPMMSAATDAGIPCDLVPAPGELGVYGAAPGSRGMARKLRSARDIHRYSFAIARWLREREVDVFHCNQTRALLVGGPGGRRARVPIVWSVRIRQTLPLPQAILAAHCATRIVTNGPDNLDDMPMSASLKARTTLVGNGTDTERFSPEVCGEAVREEFGLTPGAPMILSVGVVCPRKGFEQLIAAAPPVIERWPDARIVIVGGLPADRDASHREDLLRLAARHGVADKVVLAGRREDMPELFAACDVFVLASRQEGSPGAVLEAMATARPAVVTPPAAVAVNDQVAITVPLDDSDALADALMDLLDDPERARCMGRAGREHVVANHSVQSMVEGYERVYEDLAGGD